MTKTPNNPALNVGFLNRICDAIGLTPSALAVAAGVNIADVELLLGPRYLVTEIDLDDTWWAILAYVEKRTALMLAVRQDLSKALQSDRARRAARMARFHARPRRSAPRRPL